MSQMDSGHCVIVRVDVRGSEGDNDRGRVPERGFTAEVKDASEVDPWHGGKAVSRRQEAKHAQSCRS